MVRLIPTIEADEISATLLKRAFAFSGSIFLIGMLVLLSFLITGWVAAFPEIVLTVVAVAMIALVGVVMGGAIFYAWLRGVGHVNRVVTVWANREEAETKLIQPAPPALPDEKAALPAAEREIPTTVGGRAVEPIPLDPLFGFDPRDLRYLCRYLANGNKFTEAVMENMPLPFTPEQKLGKAQGNTPYNRFMRLCVKTEVIVERGGPGNAPGRLVVTDPDEIYRRIKALPEQAPDTQL